MQSTEIIGYRVQTPSGNFVCYEFGRNVSRYGAEPEPISQANAYRRLAAYIEENPGAQVPTVVPVYRVYTPLETASKEFSGLLSSLCERHGLRLGLSQDQIEKRIASELQELGASPIVDRINGMLGR
jgi:hypothetical protein